MTTACRRCGAPMTAAARFCTACGASTKQHVRAVAERERAERGATLRATAAVGSALAIVLFGFVVTAKLLLGEHPPASLVALAPAAIVVVAAFACASIEGGLRASFAATSERRWLLAALPVGALSAAFAFVFTKLVWPSIVAVEAPGAAVVMAVLVLAPLAEEWLCRGAVWGAAARLARPSVTLVLTSVLFAFLHGLNGGYVLELPHRFVAGLLFGWLRLRSGSLLPGIAAHAVHNSIAMLV